MTWELKSDRPIYRQLVELIELKIVSGGYGPGEKLPSVRDLASEAAVNPNTMQKALAELEQSGLVFAQRTSGRYITEDKGMINNLKDELARQQIEEFLERMGRLGFTTEQTIRLMTQIGEGKRQ
ncbi:MAG: GntR family transcriptional regulator [Acetanaerobacterium sp.]